VAAKTILNLSSKHAAQCNNKNFREEQRDRRAPQNRACSIPLFIQKIYAEIRWQGFRQSQGSIVHASLRKDAKALDYHDKAKISHPKSLNGSILLTVTSDRKSIFGRRILS